MGIISNLATIEVRTTLWFKKWQSDGYYPIEKFVWDDVRKVWKCYKQTYNMGHLCWEEICEYTHPEFIFMVTHNAGLLSDSELRSTSRYIDF